MVTAADLRVAQGYVRCGRCSSVFNALAQLSEERQSHAAAADTEAVPAEPSPAPAPSDAPASPAAVRAQMQHSPQPPAESARTQPPDEAISEDALEFNPDKTDAASVFVQPPPNPQWTAATGSFKALVADALGSAATRADDPIEVEIDSGLLSEPMQTGHPEATAAQGLPAREPAAGASPAAAPRQPTPPAGPAVQNSTPAAAVRRPGHPRPAAAAAATGKPSPGPARSAALREASSPQPPEPQPPAPVPSEAEVAVGTPRRDSPAGGRARLGWTFGAALLALMLAAQIVNHQRDALAANPNLNRPLTALYGALGVALVPHWDVRAYDVRQLGAVVAPGNVSSITVRASVRNGGSRPQPLPLLRVTLQDRFGNRIASRDVPPRDYLPAAVAPGSLLAPDQRIDAEMAFVDPGASAVGFELDACLPMRGGIACANDITSR